MKQISVFVMALICLCAGAQVPKYVPTSSLIGWWEFNDNVQNGFNQSQEGVIHGATATTDRNGNSNQAYYFNGVNSWIDFGNIINVSTQNALTISAWFKPSEMFGSQNAFTGIDIGKKTTGNVTLRVRGEWDYRFQSMHTEASPPGFLRDYTISNNTYSTNNWYHLVGVYKNGKCDLYVNGVKQTNFTSSGGLLSNIPSTATLYVGKSFNDYDVENYFIGTIDDIGIWNRELTAIEIENLNKACSLITVQPTNKSASRNSTISFSVNSSDPFATFVWQTNPCETGWQNVVSNSKYSGSTTNTLSVQNISISNHLQPFRVILNSGSCSDTSDVVSIDVVDTCLLSVSDTLIINAVVTGFPLQDNTVKVKIYPNPARNYIFVDFDNYLKMNGYTLKVISGLGSTVYSTPINKDCIEINIGDLGSKGLYVIQITNSNNEVIENRKILIL